MKRPTKQDKLDEAHAFYQAHKQGTRPCLARPKPISTCPVVDVPDLPEQGKGGVQDECLKWLKARRIFCDSHECGAGDFGSGYAVYGIKDSGDIHGYLPDGRGFEIECKAGKGGRLSVGQQKRMREIRATNALYFVVHGVEELEHFMKELI